MLVLNINLGDHLSLLNIYIKWYYTEGYKNYFCEKYNLNCETLNNIKESIKTLAKPLKKFKINKKTKTII